MGSRNRQFNDDEYGIQYDDDEDDFDEEYDGQSDYEEVGPSRSRVDNRRSASGFGRNTGDGFRRHRSIIDGGSSHFTLGEDNRRDHHNQLERKRRASIKSSYNDLRENIPSLQGSKASRALILQRAAELIAELDKSNRDRERCVEQLRRQNEDMDSRVQTLQRQAQREELSTNRLSTVVPSVGASTLRLVPSTTAHTSLTTSLPVFRLVPQDSIASSAHSTADRSGIFAGPSSSSTSTHHGHALPHHPTHSQGSSHQTMVTFHQTNSGTVHSIVPSRYRSSPALQVFSTQTGTLTGLNALSAAVGLVTDGNSTPSCSSSITCNNGEHVQSSSQRSSPGCLSSSSSSNASSLATNRTNRRESIEDGVLVMDVPSRTCDSTSVTYTPITDLNKTPTPGSVSTVSAHINPSLRPTSPPILISAPRPPTCSSVTISSDSSGQLGKHLIIHTLVHPDSKSNNDLLKRRRIN